MSIIVSVTKDGDTVVAAPKMCSALPQHLPTIKPGRWKGSHQVKPALLLRAQIRRWDDLPTRLACPSRQPDTRLVDCVR